MGAGADVAGVARGGGSPCDFHAEEAGPLGAGVAVTGPRRRQHRWRQAHRVQLFQSGENEETGMPP